MSYFGYLLWGKVCLEMHWRILLVATTMLPGCVTYGPTDLKLVSIDRVNRATEQEIPGFYEKNGSYVRPDEPALKVVFSSGTDLIKYTQGDIQVFAHADFCNEKERPPDFPGQPWFGLAWLDIHSHNKDISKMKGDLLMHKIISPPRIPTEQDGTIKYYMYVMPFRRADRYYSLPSEQLYDLTTSPRDVCLNISSSQFLSRRDSNTMRIPADLIKAALK